MCGFDTPPPTLRDIRFDGTAALAYINGRVPSSFAGFSMRRLKQLFASKTLCTCFGVGQFADPKFIEMIGLVGGWDAVWLDQEHAGLTNTELSHCVRAARATGMDVFVRVAPTDYATVMRPLEVGALGIMAAQIRSVAQAAQLVEWAKFHPAGLRGVNSSGIDGAFGTGSMAAYMQRANDETYVIPQIEHIDAVECVEQIAALPNVDALFIGPSDLSQSMGLPGQVDHPDVLKAIQRVAAACKASNVAWSILPKNAEIAKRCVEWGCTMLSLGTDNAALFRGLKSLHADYEWLRR